MRKILLTFSILILSFNLAFAGGNRWTSKPPIGSQIDWEHPLAKGLVGYWLMNEGRGKFAKNLVNLSDKLILTNNTIWGISKKGIGIKTVGTSNYAVLTTPSISLKPAKTVTIIWFGTILGAMTNSVNNPRLLSMEFNNIDGSPYVCYGIMRKSVNQNGILFSWNNGVYQESLITNYIPSSEYGMPIMFAMVLDGNKAIAKFYKNGSVNSTTNSSVGTISYTSSSLVLVGSHYTVSTTNDSNSITNTALIYNRVLSASEINQLYQDPYCFIKSPTIWSKFSTTAVAAARRIMMLD